MSYQVQLFSMATMQHFEALKHLDFFENKENLQPFSSEQFEALKVRLLAYDYEIVQSTKDRIELHKVDDEISVKAYLTPVAVYFNAGLTESDIFEICMTASEFTDTGEFAKYDPQLDEWEF